LKVLITGAAGNLGSHLAKYLMNGSDGLELRLMIHNTLIPYNIPDKSKTEIVKTDLSKPETLPDVCKDIDCIVHFAGILFEPNPESFLPTTNVTYFRNLVNAAIESNVKKIILISFPHVEGNTSPEHPSTERLDGKPISVHAQTRLQEEQYLFKACNDISTTPVSLRVGMVYGKDILMLDAGRYLMRKRLLGVWKKPTWIHLISLDDFLEATKQAIIKNNIHGIYNIGDEKPLYLQEFLDKMAIHLSYHKPWRMPEGLIFTAAQLVEWYAKLFKTKSPITKDFIRIGMVSYTGDTKRMKEELLEKLKYPTIEEGIQIM